MVSRHGDHEWGRSFILAIDFQVTTALASDAHLSGLRALDF